MMLKKYIMVTFDHVAQMENSNMQVLIFKKPCKHYPYLIHRRCVE